MSPTTLHSNWATRGHQSPYQWGGRGQSGPPRRPAELQFGNAITHFFAKVMENPSSKVIAEDLIGFGLLRTVFDLTRGFFYSHDANKGFFATIADNIRQAFHPDPTQPTMELFNKSMARERIIRESGNLFSANFLAGLVIAGLAAGVNRAGKGTLANQFGSMETQEVLAHLLKQADTPKALIQQAAAYIAGPHTDKQPAVEALLQQLHQSLSADARKAHFNDLIRLASQHTDPKSQQLAGLLRQGAVKSPEATIQKVAKQISWWENDLAKAAKKGRPGRLPEGVLQLKGALKTTDRLMNDGAVQLAKLLNPAATTLDIDRVLPKAKTVHGFSLNTLVGELSDFTNRVDQQVLKTQESWQQAGQGLLKRTRRFSRWAIPLAYGASFAFTVLVPIFNKYYTEQKDQTKSYPGVKGLKELEPLDIKKKSLAEELMPYITQENRRGNYWPLIIGMLPLPFAFGVFDNAALNSGNFKKVLNNPFVKGFGQRAFRMFQFRKGFPYMSVQQVAAICATVTTARSLLSREQTEFRERFVDSHIGWLIWIPLLPNIMTALAKRIDHAKGTVMTKLLPNGSRVMRSATEIQGFFSPAVAERTMKVLKPIKSWTFALMVFLMGVAEPLVAIKWTESQIHKEQKKSAPTPNPTIASLTPLAQSKTSAITGQRPWATAAPPQYQARA